MKKGKRRHSSGWLIHQIKLLPQLFLAVPSLPRWDGDFAVKREKRVREAGVFPSLMQLHFLLSMRPGHPPLKAKTLTCGIVEGLCSGQQGVCNEMEMGELGSWQEVKKWHPFFPFISARTFYLRPGTLSYWRDCSLFLWFLLRNLMFSPIPLPVLKKAVL